MTKRLIALALACGLLCSATGCELVQWMLFPGAGCHPQCSPAMVGSCGEECGLACGATCGPACDPAPVGCAGGTCGPADVPCGPLTLVMELLAGDDWCGDGCGEAYWGDWCSYPPDRCQRCDAWGNYTGGVPGYAGGMSGYAGDGPGYCSHCGAPLAAQPTTMSPAPEAVPAPRPAER